MGTENQQPSGGLASVLGSLGIDVSTLSAGVTGDSNDRNLLWERKKRAPVGSAEIGPGGGPGEFTMQEQADALYGGSTGATRNFPVIFKESHAEKHLYAMPDEEVGELQRRLWAGGFYPPGAKPEEIVLGDRDPYTDKAWLTLIDRAAKFHNAGRDLTIWEVLDMGANLDGSRDKKDSGRQPLVTELTNPEDLKYVAQRTAVGALGRQLRPDELNRFISSFHASQQSSQAQAYSQAGASGGTTVSAPNPTAAAETFARQADPTAAGAHDFVKVFDVFSKMLGGKRGRG